MANTLKIKRGTAATIPQGQLAEPLFTTDTYDLYIGKGSGGNQRIQNYIASGTSSEFLKGDGSLDSTTYQATSEKGQNNGYASLDSGGKVPASQLPNSVMEYKGTWNASTNNPTLADGTGNAGDVYIVSVGGTQNLGSGSITFEVGDWVMYNGAIWQKSTNSNAVVSVNGQTGVVTITFNQLSPMTTLGDLIYGGASGAGTRLAGNITTTKKFLSQTGNATISAAPSWETVTKSDVGLSNVENTALSTWAGSANITTLGTITAGTWNGTTIAIADGGTGATTKAAAFNALSPMTTLGDIIYGGTSGAGTRLAGNTAASKRFLIQTGDGTNSAAPSWGSIAAGDVPDLSATYLPLAGGTLTGGLSGTTASFNSTIQSGGDYRFAFGFPTIKWDSGSLSFYSTGGALYPLTLASNGEVIIGESGSSSPLVGVIRGSDGVGTNIAGAELRLITGRGTGSAVGGDFVVQISPAGTSGSTGNAASPVFELGNSKVRFNRLTTNGFLKTSSANGTVTVDTTSYLPLTGGTITGNLVVNGNIALIATTGFPTVGFLHRATDNILYAKMPSGGFAFSDSLNNINLSISSSGALTGTSATFSLANDITLTARSGAAGSYTYWSLGRTSSELELGVAAAANQFFTGTAAGDVIIKANGSSNKLMLGYGSGSPTLTLASTGAATFSGAVGIGVTPNASWNSAYRILQFGTTGALYAENGDAAVYLGSNNYIDSAGYKYLTTDFASLYSQENGVHTFRVAASGTAGNAITWTNALTIANTGAATFSSSVTAGGLLSINGDATLVANFNYASNGTYVRWQNNGTSFGDIGSGSSLISGGSTNDFAIHARSTYNIVFATNFTERMRITSGGNVGIGTNSPVEKLDINSTMNLNGSSGCYASIQYNASTRGYFGTANAVIASGANNDFGISATSNLVFGTGGSYTERMRITSGGIVSVGATDGLTTSTYAGKLSVYTAGGANLSIGGASNTTNTVMSRLITINNNNGNTGNESSTSFIGITSIESALTTATSNASGNSGGYIMFKTKGDAGTLDERMRITSGGAIEATGSIKTGAPTGYTAGAMKFGQNVTGSCTVGYAYLPVTIDGTLYYIAMASPN